MSRALRIQNFSVLKYGNRRIPYSIERTDRQRLRIDVHPDQCVIVRAPRDKARKEIEDRVRKRASWIVRQQRHFARFQPLPPPRQYVSGETHRYLGRQYRLKVSSSMDEDIRLLGKYFVVRVGDRTDRASVRRAMDTWYSDHARTQFSKRLEPLWQRLKRYGIDKPDLQVRVMKKRWGSCTKAGNITLNIELVKAPSHCIDYVIMHELCHLIVPKHNDKFYQLLSRCIPDWEKRKERLAGCVL